MKKRVAVLMGGFSGEREVSLSSAQGVLMALQELGHEAIPIDVTRNMEKLVQNLEIHKPDVVLNILHGRWGEDGCIQGLLEMMDIPYSHSGVLGSALSMNKIVARNICQVKGIRIPEGQVAQLVDVCAGHIMKPPFVIKPIGEGSSLGVHIILDETTPLPNPQEWPFEEEVLVEKYIPGREIQVAVLGGKAIGAIEIRPHGTFYDYEAKYTDGKAIHLMPAPIHPEVYAQVLEWAEKAHKGLECRGVSRSDFRYDDTHGEPGTLYYLETNPQPGLTPLSLVPEIVAHEGMTYAQLVQWMVEDASCRR
ncbi:MAG: D-alanine--D-alanine ligase [Alphaproteobacteria bacterium 41-28]|nr:MAG: D-alanine--D-alanine ligase [Alphaproteobacteria bacterium 41-28]